MINLKSCIYSGDTSHCRFTPNRHNFRYPLFFLCLELSELPSMRSWVLSYNRKALLTLRDDDYLRDLKGSISSKFAELLKKSEISTIPQKTYLLTLPRLLGYVFNPVNFYISLNETGQLHSFVAEVSNTFGEVHTYVLDKPIKESDQNKFTFHFQKEFYVSPFLETGGMYHLTLDVQHDRIRISIDLDNGKERVFSASLSGHSIPISNFLLLSSILKFPLACAGTMLRIKFQSLILVFSKGVNIFLKPSPSHPNTYTYRMSWLYTVRMWILQKFKTIRIF